MKIRNIITSIAIVLSANTPALLVSPVAHAHEGHDHGKPQEIAQATPQTPTPATPTSTTIPAFRYIAQRGDSYTQMARKAVQTYGIQSKVTLTPAQIIYAETVLTQAAGSPYLNLGQVVTMQNDPVKKVVEQASELTAAQQAAWEVYVPHVDFNTNNVGEAR